MAFTASKKENFDRFFLFQDGKIKTGSCKTIFPIVHFLNGSVVRPDIPIDFNVGVSLFAQELNNLGFNDFSTFCGSAVSNKLNGGFLVRKLAHKLFQFFPGNHHRRKICFGWSRGFGLSFYCSSLSSSFYSGGFHAFHIFAGIRLSDTGRLWFCKSRLHGFDYFLSFRRGLNCSWFNCDRITLLCSS